MFNVASLTCICLFVCLSGWLLVLRKKSSGWCTFGLCVETKRNSARTLHGGCWTSRPRAQSRSSEDTRAHTRSHSSGWKMKMAVSTMRCVTFSLKQDCFTWTVLHHWTHEWSYMVGCMCDSQLIVLHFRCRFVFSSSLHSRVCGKAVPFLSNNDLKGIVQPDMLPRLLICGKGSKANINIKSQVYPLLATLAFLPRLYL